VLALLDQHLRDLGGTYGDPNAGDPIQYDQLRIEHDQGAVEIVVYNRALLLFVTDSEAVRRVRPADTTDRPARAVTPCTEEAREWLASVAKGRRRP